MSNLQDSWDRDLMGTEDQEEEVSAPVKEVDEMIGSTHVGREGEVGAEVPDESTEKWGDDISSETSEKSGGSGIKLKKRRRNIGTSTILTRSIYWVHFNKFFCDVDKMYGAPESPVVGMSGSSSSDSIL
ncbi:hypothetical protein ACS0TY_033319 [Phlomoides rotata]